MGHESCSTGHKWQAWQAVRLGSHERTQHDTLTTAPRRSDYGAERLGRHDIDGLILCAKHFGAPYDLLASALGAQPARLRAITAR
jgi:hypothetical protein